VAQPAHFGHREETILDPAVRDTGEISPDLVRLDGPSWDNQGARSGQDAPGHRFVALRAVPVRAHGRLRETL
jgi:hypothetical protein